MYVASGLPHSFVRLVVSHYYWFMLIHFLSLGYYVYAGEKCSFRNGECTYHIQLSHTQGECPNNAVSYQDAASLEATKDSIRNDYSRKVNGLESDVRYMKKGYEQRIKQLENTIERMAYLASPPVTPTRTKVHRDGKQRIRLKSPLELDSVDAENRLLTQIHDEFSVLRETLITRTQLLGATERKLNETLATLEIMQDQVLKTNRELVSSVDQLYAMEQESFLLKNQLERRTSQLHDVTENLNATEQTLKEREAEIQQRTISEQVVKDELEYFQKAMNETSVMLRKALKRYHYLLETKNKCMETLSRREQQLILCYTAKTATFCGFEDPKTLCGFKQDNTTDYFDWSIARGSTPSGNTGPERDHTCAGARNDANDTSDMNVTDGTNDNKNTGHFLYIEASARGKGQNAIIYSPRYRGLSQQCLEFYYHMYGRHVGTLNVYTRVYGNVLSAAWRAYGNQGNFWSLARLQIPEYLAKAGYQVAFEGITEAGYQGDIAIDDVRVNDGLCPVDPKVTPVQVDVVLPDIKPTEETGPFPDSGKSKIKSDLSREDRKRRRKMKRLRKRLLEKMKSRQNITRDVDIKTEMTNTSQNAV